MHDKMPLFDLAHTLNKQADQLYHRLALLADRLIGPRLCANGQSCPPQPGEPCLADHLEESQRRLAACHDLAAVIEEATGGQVEAMECATLGPACMGEEREPSRPRPPRENPRDYLARERR